MSSQPAVVLPSIHEMFPDFLIKQPPHNSRLSHRKSMSSPRTSPFHHPYSLPFPSSDHHRRHPSASDSSPQQHPAHIPRPIRLSAPPLHHQHGPSPSSSSSSSPEFSFNVLRSDPSSSSLQHLASSQSAQHQNPHAHPRHHHSPSSSISSSSGYDQVSIGSAPAFRVSFPASSGSSSPMPYTSSVVSSPTARSPGAPRPPGTEPLYSSPSITSGAITRKQDAVRIHRHPSPPGGSAYSTLSFPVSGSDTSAPVPATPVTGSRGDPQAATGLVSSRDRSPNDDPDNGASDGEFSANGKKHVCPTCSKRFNRPSSLRIHVNTHTGATPFRCPWPDCGREFNVNSNMRRHYRNHTTPGFSRPQPTSATLAVPPPLSSISTASARTVDRRRRRRVAPHNLVFVTGDASVPAPPHGVPHHPGQHLQQPSISRLSPLSVSDGEEDEMSDEEVDELGMDVDSEDTPRSSPSSSSSRSHGSPAPTFQRYSQSDMRSVYPYARVSTTLRPAFVNDVKVEH